jgi:hypothetical protein
MTGSSAEMQLRIRYTKLGKIRFTSQRDVARLWERALRRSRLPVAWSKGFSPRPLLSFGLALPTGAESLGEYLDIELDSWDSPGREVAHDAIGILDPVTSAALSTFLSSLLPDGLSVQAVAPVPAGSGSLQHEVSSCTWELEVAGVTEVQVARQIDAVLRSSNVPVRRVRKGRMLEDDIRPAIRSLTLGADCGRDHRGTEGTVALSATVATKPRGVRPGELLEGLEADLVLVRARRTHQWIEHGDARWEPLSEAGELPGETGLHAQERAS